MRRGMRRALASVRFRPNSAAAWLCPSKPQQPAVFASLVWAHRGCATAAAAAAATPRFRADARLVDLPEDVRECCTVYRNVLSPEKEQRLWEEIQYLLEKAGTKSYAPSGEGLSREKALVRNVSVDLHGFDEYREVRDHQKQEIRRVPGLVWSETLTEFAKTVGKELLGDEPDTVRILEHHLPGYEMHVEAPPFGQAFVAMHLFAPGVINFDNEAMGERGSVLLPERCAVKVDGALRWGWRVGESFDPVMRFPKLREEFEPEYRIGLWFFKFNTKLADFRQFAEGMEANMTEAAKHRETEIKAEDVVVLPSSSAHAEPEAPPDRVQFDEVQRREQIAKEKAEEEQFAREALGEAEGAGEGLLGGDLPSSEVKSGARQFRQPDNQKTAQDQFAGYKQDFARVNKIIERMADGQKNGENVDEGWMRNELARAMSSSSTRGRPGEPDVMGHDDNNPAKTWDEIANRADHYKKKLQAMDFDASPTEDAAVKNATKMKKARDDLLGDIPVEPFDPRKAARILEQNRESLRARAGK